jgi:hypothetical protein
MLWVMFLAIEYYIELVQGPFGSGLLSDTVIVKPRANLGTWSKSIPRLGTG